jgi:antirestriction protein ArdC
VPTATKSRTNGKTKDVYKEVTDRIIAALEEGTVPWRRPWKIEGGHRNLVSKKPYRGINPFLLELTAMEEGYEKPYWVTYKQAEALGGNVKKGEKSTLVVFWKILNFDTDERDKDGNKKVKKVPLLRYYRVFNVAQCEGIEDKVPVIEENDFDPIERAEQVISDMPNPPSFSWGGDRAYYNFATDAIRLPAKKRFDSAEAYYSTAYHEMIHSTGHKDRLGRIKDWAMFGSDPYAQEELVAEMGAAMLCGVSGIEVQKENTAAYIQHWIERFKDDKKLLVSAAGQAQKAADSIIEEES